MSDTALYISYFIAHKEKRKFIYERIRNIHSLLPPETDASTSLQENAVQEFLDKQSFAKIVHSFTETPDNLRTNKWPQLLKAITACQESGATLLIANLGALTNNTTFTELLLDSSIKFYCCDQPFITPTILEALSKHAQVQKKLHGELIRKGLKVTSAKSGNPNAAAVINKVNKPKIDTAIVFAFLLQPLIADYRRKGYSQRKMVKMLNEEGFTAPEGGKWVLSQLQKVLDRIKLNEIANELSSFVMQLRDEKLSLLEIADKLNNKHIPSIKRHLWDEGQVAKLFERIQQIQEITMINRFVLDLLPILHTYRHQGLTEFEILAELNHAGIPIKDNIAITV